MVMGLVASIAHSLAAGHITASAVVAHYLSRAEELQTRFNTLTSLDRAGASYAAIGSDERWRRGGQLSNIDGVPFVVKDTLLVSGMAATAGSRLLEHHRSELTAPFVAKLQQLGCIVLGKSNTPEFALDLHTENDLFGATLNPRDIRLSPGGSSGGDAASVAAGIAPFAVGTDYGGSIRWPARCCGVVGYRPGPGLLSNHGRIPSILWQEGASTALYGSLLSFDHSFHSVGLIANSGADIKYLVEELGRAADHRVAVSRPVNQVGERGKVVSDTPVRWGIPTESMLSSLSRTEAQAVRGVAGQLKAAGEVVTRFDCDWLFEASRLYTSLRATDGQASLLKFASNSVRRGLLTNYAQAALRIAERSVAVHPHGRDMNAEALGNVALTVSSFRPEIDVFILPIASGPPPPAAVVSLAGKSVDEVEESLPSRLSSGLWPSRGIAGLRLPSLAVSFRDRENGWQGVQVVAHLGYDGVAIQAAITLETLMPDLGSVDALPLDVMQ